MAAVQETSGPRVDPTTLPRNALLTRRGTFDDIPPQAAGPWGKCHFVSDPYLTPFIVRVGIRRQIPNQLLAKETLPLARQQFLATQEQQVLAAQQHPPRR